MCITAHTWPATVLLSGKRVKFIECTLHFFLSNLVKSMCVSALPSMPQPLTLLEGGCTVHTGVQGCCLWLQNEHNLAACMVPHNACMSGCTPHSIFALLSPHRRHCQAPVQWGRQGMLRPCHWCCWYMHTWGGAGINACDLATPTQPSPPSSLDVVRVCIHRSVQCLQLHQHILHQHVQVISHHLHAGNGRPPLNCGCGWQ